MNSFVETTQFRLDPNITMRTVSDTPSFIRCSPEFVRNHCGEYAASVVDQIVSWNIIPEDKLKISATSQRLGKNAFSSTPGWHHDWYGPTSWEYYEQDKPFIGIFHVGNTAPVEFFEGELPDGWDVRYPSENNDDFWRRRHVTLNNHLNQNNGTTMLTEAGVVYKMFHNSIHRPTPSSRLGHRILFRIEGTDLPPANRIINSITSYLPVDDYHNDHV